MASEGGRVDLHVHSSFSDGSYSPKDILSLAGSLGLAAVSITDHDTVAGAAQAMTLEKPRGLAFVPGVEISSSAGPEEDSASFHILGYFIDPEEEGLASALADVQQARNERNPRIIRRLRELGVDLSLEEVKAVAGVGQVGRPHIARVLVEKKAAQNMEDAFRRYLGEGKAAYVPKRRLPPEQAIRVIREAGGVPVLAHPGTLDLDGPNLEDLIRSLRDLGLRGLEAYYPSHTPAKTFFYRDMAARLGLVATGGSDFHGENKPEVRLGSGTGSLSVPFSVYEDLLRESRRLGG